jgi:hypothetical protein
LQNFVGGCDATKKLQFDGKLFPMIRSSLVQDVESTRFSGIKGSALEKGNPLSPTTFFDFPAVTDDRVIRLVGLQVCPRCYTDALVLCLPMPETSCPVRFCP